MKGVRSRCLSSTCPGKGISYESGKENLICERRKERPACEMCKKTFGSVPDLKF